VSKRFRAARAISAKIEGINDPLQINLRLKFDKFMKKEFCVGGGRRERERERENKEK